MFSNSVEKCPQAWFEVCNFFHVWSSHGKILAQAPDLVSDSTPRYYTSQHAALSLDIITIITASSWDTPTMTWD